MKKSLFNFVAVTVLSTAFVTIPVISNAADSSTNSAAAKAGSSTPGKISGTVSAVDTNAMTFTVDGQTYSETSSSILTRNGKPATLSDVAVGDPVQGSCTTGSDGKLQATKVHFGKGAEKSSAKTTAKKSSKKKKKSAGSATNSVPEAPAMPDAAPTTATPTPAPAPTAPAPANAPGTM